MIRRRHVLGASLAMPFVARAQAGPRVVVVGGGFGGATAARFVQRYGPAIRGDVGGSRLGLRRLPLQ